MMAKLLDELRDPVHDKGAMMGHKAPTPPPTDHDQPDRPPPPPPKKSATDKRTRQTVAKLMAAIDRTLRAVEAVKQARQELSRLTSDEREGGASNDAA